MSATVEKREFSFVDSTSKEFKYTLRIDYFDSVYLEEVFARNVEGFILNLPLELIEDIRDNSLAMKKLASPKITKAVRYKDVNLKIIGKNFVSELPGESLVVFTNPDITLKASEIASFSDVLIEIPLSEIPSPITNQTLVRIYADGQMSNGFYFIFASYIDSCVLLERKIEGSDFISVSGYVQESVILSGDLNLTLSSAAIKLGGGVFTDSEIIIPAALANITSLTIAKISASGESSNQKAFV